MPGMKIDPLLWPGQRADPTALAQTEIDILGFRGVAAATIATSLVKALPDVVISAVREDAGTGARLRIRPILMTSMAFGFGVLPLALASGAGANSRIAIGTSVVGGVLTGTALAIFFIPLFFVLVRRGVRDGMKAARKRFGRNDDPDTKTEPNP